MWNGQRASVVNQMPTNAQKDDDHHNMQTGRMYLKLRLGTTL